MIPKDEITLIYNINKNKEEVKIFHNCFIYNNKNNCKIIYEDKEYELKETFNIKNINQNKLEIKLKGITKINNIEYMFCE